MPPLFLLFSFFFPRFTLVVVWLLGAMPANQTPFIADVLAAIFAPRFLIAWWLYEAQAHPLLIGLFVLAGIWEFLHSSRRTKIVKVTTDS